MSTIEDDNKTTWCLSRPTSSFYLRRLLAHHLRKVCHWWIGGHATESFCHEAEDDAGARQLDWTSAWTVKAVEFNAVVYTMQNDFASWSTVTLESRNLRRGFGPCVMRIGSKVLAVNAIFFISLLKYLGLSIASCTRCTVAYFYVTFSRTFDPLISFLRYNALVNKEIATQFCRKSRWQEDVFAPAIIKLITMTGKLRIDKKFPPRHWNTWKKRTARFVGSALVDFTFVGVVPFSTSVNVTGSLTDDRCVHCYAKITFPLGRLILAWEKHLRVLDKMGVIDFFGRISGAKHAIYSVFLRVDSSFPSASTAVEQQPMFNSSSLRFIERPHAGRP